MKKTAIVSVLLLIGFCGVSQTPQQIDSANVHLRDSLYNVKSDFIGRPFANLADALSNNFSFSLPSGANKKKGTGYYKHPSIFLNHSVGVPNRGFSIEFTEYMPVDLGKIWVVGLNQWDVLMRTYLRTAIVTDIQKL